MAADLHLQPKTTNRILEIRRQDSTAEFLTEFIQKFKTNQFYSQFVSQPSSSQLLSKYGSNKGQYSEQRALVEEFDPLKHMNIEQPDTVVRATDCLDHTPSFGDNFAAVSVRDMLALPNLTLHNSQSWDSLKEIVVSPEESREFRKATKNQLVMASGTELPESKSVSSRDKFLRQCVSKRESEFTEIKSFTLFCGSWNVDNQSPPDNLSLWLLVDKETPDMYAIGLQELDTSKEAVMLRDSPKETEWLEALSKCLNSKVAYMKVKSIRLVGMLLVVFIQEKLAKHVTYIDADTVPTGIMGVMGNKGGVSVRLNFHNKSLCFVSSHLAAHQEEVEKRNMDYKTIMSKMRFKLFDPPLEIAEHDIVFWSGDLNYRIDLPIDLVKTHIKNRDYARLFPADQLHQQMDHSKVFQGFNEGVLNFDPTFKFDPGTDIYDTSEKQRIPAWCDRILWSGYGVQQLRFSSHSKLKLSDHKPVSSLFNVGVRIVDKKRYKHVYEEVMQKLDRLEMEHSPNVKLGTTECVSQDANFTEVCSPAVTVARVRQEIPGHLSKAHVAQDGGWLSMSPKEMRKFVNFLFKYGSS